MLDPITILERKHDDLSIGREGAELLKSAALYLRTESLTTLPRRLSERVASLEGKKVS